MAIEKALSPSPIGIEEEEAAAAAKEAEAQQQPYILNIIFFIYNKEQCANTAKSQPETTEPFFKQIIELL